MQQQKNVKKYHRKTRWMSCLALSLETMISVSEHPLNRKKCGNIGWKTKRHFWNMMFHNTEKTETRHENASQISFGARTTTPKSLKEAGFVFLLHKLAFIVSRVDWCVRTADMTKCEHCLIRKGICDWKHAEEPREINGTWRCHDYI